MNLRKQKLGVVGVLSIFKLKRTDEIRTFRNANLQLLLKLGRWRRERKKQSLRQVGPHWAEEPTSVRNEAYRLGGRDIHDEHELTLSRRS
jgi:hypothetical protein